MHKRLSETPDCTLASPRNLGATALPQPTRADVTDIEHAIGERFVRTRLLFDRVLAPAARHLSSQGVRDSDSGASASRFSFSPECEALGAP